MVLEVVVPGSDSEQAPGEQPVELVVERVEEREDLLERDPRVRVGAPVLELH